MCLIATKFVRQTVEGRLHYQNEELVSFRSAIVRAQRYPAGRKKTGKGIEVAKSKLKSRLALCAAIFTLATALRLSGDTPQGPAYQAPSSGDVIAFLLRSVDWYRHTYAEQQVATDPVDLLFLDDNQPLAAQIVRLSFDFGKAEAALATNGMPAINPPQANGAPDSGADLAHFLALKNQTNQASQKATEEIDAIKTEMASVRRADRKKLQAALDEAQSRLDLLELGSKTLDNLIEFLQSDALGKNKSDSLGSTIDGLAQTLPEVNDPATASTRLSERDAASQANARARAGGIMGLISQVSALHTKLGIIDEKVVLTDNLSISAQKLQNPAAAFTKTAQSDAFRTFDTSDPASLLAQKKRLDALTIELKSVSPALVSLDKQRFLLSVYKSHLGSWRNEANAQYRQAWKKLVLRFVLLGLIIGFVAGMSEASLRVTLRRIQDPNRRRSVALVYRLVSLFTILVITAFTFATDSSSLATYLGLLTAGLTVAFQNVIVASLGHLMLAGKRGFKIGDRVEISGVTGDVIDMGLLQFQLREFDAHKQRFTGRVATFSNSLVFSTSLLRRNPDDPEASDCQWQSDCSLTRVNGA